MKKILYFSALSVLAIAMASCANGTSSSASNSQEDSTVVVETLEDTTALPQKTEATLPVSTVAPQQAEAAQPEVDSNADNDYNEEAAKAFATKFFKDKSEELVCFKKYMTPELYAKCKDIIQHTWVENLDEIPFSEWMAAGEGKHITKPGVFISSLGDGKFQAIYSEESDFAGDEGGYSNEKVRIKVGKVNGEYRVINIFNNHPKHKWVLND